MNLDDLTPHISLKRKIINMIGTIGIIFVCVISFNKTEIDFLKLFRSRQNAVSYIFGKELSSEDHQDAMRQAKLYPRLMVREEARRIVKNKYKNRKRPSYELLQKEIKNKADLIYYEKSKTEWTEWVNSEYIDILDDKKGGYFPPEYSSSKIKEYLWALLETIYIAIWGSLLAFLTAIPFAFLAARNTLEIILPGNNKFIQIFRNSIYFLIRRFLDICRGFNEFVMALIFVAVIGLGPFAGVLALWIHTLGILGKVFSENIETIGKGPVEGIQSTGASTFQILSFAIIPQIIPHFITYALLRFETNVRSATILGFCGAGGIGFLMFDKINGYLYREVATMMIIIIVTIGTLDYFTSMLRRKYI